MSFAAEKKERASDTPIEKSISFIKKIIEEKTLEVAIPGEFKRRGEKLTNYERIGGLTNRNYKLCLGGENLILRLPGRGTGRFINRANERSNQLEASRAGFSPEALYFSKITGVKLSSFLENALTFSPQLVRQQEHYTRIAGFLREFHHAPVRFVNTFNGFEMLKSYERLAKSRFIRFYRHYDDIRDRVLELESRLSLYVPCACHNDLVPENILLVDGKLQLIDWEYSGMNDPAWDIASFLLESDFNEDESLRFLEAYMPAAQKSFMQNVSIHKIVQDILWSLWALLQANSNKSSEKDNKYLPYGVERFNRAIDMIDKFEATYIIP